MTPQAFIRNIAEVPWLESPTISAARCRSRW